MSLSEAGYRVSWVAPWFHSIPHIDYTFTNVNSTFDPKSSLYLESLGIIASVPGFWLILNLLAFLIFFLSRCCEREWKPRNITAYKWSLGVLAILCCGAVGIGFYGNDDVHTGMEDFTTAMQEIDNVITSVKNKTFLMEEILETNTEPEIDRLDGIFERPIVNSTARDVLLQTVRAMRTEVLNGTRNIARINNKLRRIDVAAVPDFTHHLEIIRWPSTMTALSLFMFFCVVLLVGVIKSSRSILIAFTVLGLLAVILHWLLVSVYLVSCVALSDLCVEPDAFILRQASGTLDRNIINYYLNCTEGKESPFLKSIKDGQKAVDNVGSKVDFLAGSAVLYYPEKELHVIIMNLASQLNRTQQMLGSMVSLLDCQLIYSQYEAALTATCTPLLNGLSFMLLSAVTAGLMFIFLIWIAAHTWIYIRKRSGYVESDYVQVDEQDPFLPPSAASANTPTPSSRRQREAAMSGRPRHSHTPPQTPPFPGAYNGRIPRGAEDQSPMHGRYTPPPSYEQLSWFVPSAHDKF